MTLNKGDKIGIIALSGVCDREKINKSKVYLESLGYSVELSKNIFDENRYLAGNDEVKVKELHNFFKNPDIKLILCARGGYGGIRLINKINYNVIKENPKPICGFSDVTSILLMIYKKTGIMTYHSPMAQTDFCLEPGEANHTISNFFETINKQSFCYYGDKIYKNGKAEGILWGGNLSTVVSLCGQDFLPDKDFIFFTEDLNEPVYKIDKMFYQLINIPIFRKYCKGIILGDFLDMDNYNWLDNLFQELSEELNKPIASGFKITHSVDKIAMPIGAYAKLNGIELQIIKHM